MRVWAVWTVWTVLECLLNKKCLSQICSNYWIGDPRLSNDNSCLLEPSEHENTASWCKWHKICCASNIAGLRLWWKSNRGPLLMPFGDVMEQGGLTHCMVKLLILLKFTCTWYRWQVGHLHHDILLIIE